MDVTNTGQGGGERLHHHETCHSSVLGGLHRDRV